MMSFCNPFLSVIAIVVSLLFSSYETLADECPDKIEARLECEPSAGYLSFQSHIGFYKLASEKIYDENNGCLGDFDPAKPKECQKEDLRLSCDYVPYQWNSIYFLDYGKEKRNVKSRDYLYSIAKSVPELQPSNEWGPITNPTVEIIYKITKNANGKIKKGERKDYIHTGMGVLRPDRILCFIVEEISFNNYRSYILADLCVEKVSIISLPLDLHTLF